MKELNIDETFKKLIPPLTEEEYSQLEKNILSDGCREPLVVWNGIIIDGHNRYKICSDNNISFNTEEKDFSSREQAVEWIILNQFGRRNLSLIQRGELALKLKPIFQEKAKENQTLSEGRGKQFCQNSDKTVKKVDTKKELAKIAGVSHDTITKTEKILKKGTEEQINRARQGGKGNTLNAIYHEIRQQEEETKVCRTCGKTFPISNFYKGKNDCTTCYGQNTAKIRDAKGNIYKVSDEYKNKDKEVQAIIDDLYSSKTIRHTVDDLIRDFTTNFNTFEKTLRGIVEDDKELLKEEENNKKFSVVLDDAVSAIEKIKGDYIYEK